MMRRITDTAEPEATMPLTRIGAASQVDSLRSREEKKKANIELSGTSMD